MLIALRQRLLRRPMVIALLITIAGALGLAFGLSLAAHDSPVHGVVSTVGHGHHVLFGASLLVLLGTTALARIGALWLRSPGRTNLRGSCRGTLARTVRRSPPCVFRLGRIQT